jgi:hypothetical protein
MFVLINRIKDDTIEIKAEFILLVSNIEYHYLSFIRIKFYQPSILPLWDNCGQVNSDRLENLQLEAARILQG